MRMPGTGLMDGLRLGPARLSACVAACVLALLLLASWQRHDWPAWPLAGLIITVPAALWVAHMERAVINWPAGVSALLGALTGGLLGLLAGALPTGLESSSRGIAMCAIVPTLAAGPMIVCSWARARRAYAVGCAGALAVAGFAGARFFAGSATVLLPVETGRLALLIGLALFAALPLVWALVRARHLMTPSLLCALGLVLLAYVGTSAMLQRWAFDRLTDPATFLRLQATKEDTQDPFAVGFDDGVLAMNILQADLERLQDHITALVATGERRADVRGRIFLPYSANERGEPQPLADLVGSRWIRLVEKGTVAKPVTGEPMVVLAESVHHGARRLTWPSWWGWVVAMAAGVCMVGRKRCPGHIALGVAVALALLSMGLWRE